MAANTKVIATLGRDYPEPLERMIGAFLDAGADLFRLNFSHIPPDRYGAIEQSIRSIREAAAGRGQEVGILADLQGPRLRIGRIESGARELAAGDRVVLEVGAPDQCAAPGALLLESAEVLGALRPKSRVLLMDGRIQLEMAARSSAQVEARVLVGGRLRERAGLHLPDGAPELPSLTAKDLRDLEFIAAQRIELIALSFVRSAADVEALRRRLRILDHEQGLIVAKVETREAVERAEEIIEAADALMVARGDLGVTLELEQVPMAQKRLLGLCAVAAKPAITATEMLTSMIDQPRPTRAEVSDLANAVLDGSDAILLTGETAAGRHPVEAVAVAERILGATESEARRLEPLELHLARMRRRLAAARDHRLGQGAPAGELAADSLAAAASELAAQLECAALVVATGSGATARRLARFRPRAPILATSPSAAVRRALTLSYGVRALPAAPGRDIGAVLRAALDAGLKRGWLRSADRVVLVAGWPFGRPTNRLICDQVGVLLDALGPGQDAGGAGR
jgi:pyruvate kinase